MEYAHAILALAENDRELSEDNITAVLEAAGVTVTPSRVKAFVAALEGVDIDAVNAQALALSAPEGESAMAVPDRDVVMESVTTEAFMSDFSPADPVELDEAAGEESGAFGLDTYSPLFPEDATESEDADAIDDEGMDDAADDGFEGEAVDEEADVADEDDLFAESDDEESDELESSDELDEASADADDAEETGR